MEFMAFLTVAILAFALVMLLAGIFTAYFGTGKSRTIGFVLLAVGLIVGVLWVYLAGLSDIEALKVCGFTDVVLQAILDFLAIMIGAIVAVAVFLVAVMKS
ncbi:MAG: hypothetical protein E7Z67_00815 [Thermoplasmata archaeon]|nr:hypothetical protein [Thermoplasmata archaeon]